MKTITFFISLMFCFIFNNLNAQEGGGGVIKFSLKTTPELVINKVTFFDKNSNNMIDVGENSYFQLIVKNVGKTSANNPILETEIINDEKSGILFEKRTYAEPMIAGQSLIINVPVTGDQKLESGIANFGFTISDDGKYKSKQFVHKIQTKKLRNNINKLDGSFASEWNYPLELSTNITKPNLKIEVCVKTDKPLTKVLIYVNKKLQLVKNNSKPSSEDHYCNYIIEKELKLQKGRNEIELKISTKEKTITSEKRYVTYRPAIMEHRNALVIGNGNYNSSPLENPSNDAKDIANSLRKLNFDVIELIDADKKTMREAIRRFRDKMKVDRGVGLFYYAGHGVQVKGDNYLIPINHEIEEEFDVQDESIRVNTLLAYMQDAGTRMNIVILDACRDNPFASSMRSSSRGLASIYAEGGGSIIAYATAPGSTASDGDGSNGLYTQELLKAINTPGLEIGMVFRHVLANVQKRSNGKQIPWTNSSIIGEFYFAK